MRFPQRWGGPTLVSLGILMMLIGLTLQSLSGRSARIDAAITPANTTLLVNQKIQIQNFIPHLDQFNQIMGGEITVNVNDTKPATWRLYRPYRVADWWIIPGGIHPVAQIKLTQNQRPAETIEQVFPNATEPVYFIYSEQALVFELRYLATANGPGYQLKLAAASEKAPIIPEIVQNDTSFSIPDFDLSGQITIHEKLRLQAYQFSTLGVSMILGGLLLASMGLITLTLAPPNILWLKVITKGRGSRIEVEAEILRTMPPNEETLDQILVLPPLNTPDD